MIAVATQAVSPTIVHAAAFNSNTSGGGSCGSGNSRSDGNRRERRAGSSGKRRGRMADRCDIVRAVETGGTGREFAEAFLITELEFGLKDRKRPLSAGAEAEFFCGGREKATFFDHRQRQGNDGDVGDLDLAKSSNTMNVADLCPEIFNGIIEVPWFGEGGAIGFQFLGGHGSVFSLQMSEHSERRNVAKTEVGVFEGAKKRWVHRRQDLSGKGRAEAVVQGDIGEGLIVGTDGLGQLCSSGASSDGSRSGMERDVERDTGAGEIVDVVEQHR